MHVSTLSRIVMNRAFPHHTGEFGTAGNCDGLIRKHLLPSTLCILFDGFFGPFESLIALHVLFLLPLHFQRRLTVATNMQPIPGEGGQLKVQLATEKVRDSFRSCRQAPWS